MNAAEKMPMYEMPFNFCVWGFGVGGSQFCNRVLGDGVLSWNHTSIDI